MSAANGQSIRPHDSDPSDETQRHHASVLLVPLFQHANHTSAGRPSVSLVSLRAKPHSSR